MTFGGHAMAAGLRLKLTDLEAFRTALVNHVNERLPENELRPRMVIDTDCALDAITLDLVQQIEKLKPFGQGNRMPLLRVGPSALPVAPQRIGKTGSHLRLTLSHQRSRIKAVGFGLGDWADQLRQGEQVETVAEAHLNEWNGRRSAELHVKDLRVSR